MSIHKPGPMRVSAGQSPIFQAGQTGGVWRVRQGVVRLDRHCGPSRLPVQLALPGDLIGVEALCGQPYQFSAEALTACELEPVALGTRDDLLALGQRARLLGDVLLQQQRLSHLLRLLGLPWQGAQSVASHQADAVRESLPTLREVADLIDAKTETVCRALAQLLPPRSRKSGPVSKANAVGAPTVRRTATAWTGQGAACAAGA